MKNITITDKDILESFIKNHNLKASEVNFTNLFLWKEKYLFSYTIINEFLWIVNRTHDNVYFSQPIGNYEAKDKLLSSIDQVKELFNKPKITLKKCDKEFVTLIQTLLEVEVEEKRDDFDYLYNFSDLKDLSGNRYHKKKNHINHFKKHFNWKFEKMSSYNLKDVKVIIDEWFNGATDSLLEEKNAIEQCLRYFDDLSVFGGLLYVEGKPIAFTIGEKTLDSTLLIHFEKALKNYQGAYTMIMQQFLNLFDGLETINREQDLGIEGLRKSKLSYHPIGFINKYNVEL